MFDLLERGASTKSKLPDDTLSTNFGIGVLLKHLLHTLHIIFFLLELHFYLFDNKIVKHAQNAAFDFPYLMGHKRIRRDTNNFFNGIETWNVSFINIYLKIGLK